MRLAVVSVPRCSLLVRCFAASVEARLLPLRPDPRGRDTTIIAPLPRSTVISVPVPLATAPRAAQRLDAVPPVPVDLPDAVPVGVPDAVPGAVPPHRAAEPPRPEGVRFVLQFSTGETVNVHGSGLVGRRPLPQPGEVFDHLVQIQDSGMSVSKSHLEFGQHGGQFWVSDRFSGNGSVLQRPAEGPLRCEPGRRYLVPRGSRVDIADQYFVLA